MVANGGWLAVVGAAGIVVGVVLIVVGVPLGIGLTIALLGSIPFVAGAGLVITGAVSRRARSGRPFA